MAKSIKTPTKSKQEKGKQEEKGNVLGNIGAVSDIVNSVTNLIKTISEERRKTEELRLEGIRITAEIEDRISQRENETMRILAQYEIELKEIEKSIINIETQAEVNIKQIELDREINRQNHEFRMRRLDLIEKIVDAALEQYRYYKNEIIIYNREDLPVIDVNLLNTMNSTINELTATISQANMRTVDCIRE